MQYDYAVSFGEGLAAVKKGDNWGFIDQKGKTVIALQYEEAWAFLGDVAPVKQDGKYGLIDKTGKIIASFKFDGFEPEHDGEHIQGYLNGKTVRVNIQTGEVL